MGWATKSLEVDLKLNQVTPFPHHLLTPLLVMHSDHPLSQLLMLAKVLASPMSLTEACTFCVMYPLGAFLAKLNL